MYFTCSPNSVYTSLLPYSATVIIPEPIYVPFCTCFVIVCVLGSPLSQRHSGSSCRGTQVKQGPLQLRDVGRQDGAVGGYRLRHVHGELSGARELLRGVTQVVSGPVPPHAARHRARHGSGTGGPHPRDQQEERSDPPEVGRGAETGPGEGRGVAVPHPP